MATYDTSTGLRALTGGSLISEIDDGFLAMAQDVAARLPTYVTTLPAVPYDGQEVYYRTLSADTANDLNVLWHLRWRAGSPFTHKWEAVGGAPLRDSKTTDGVGTGSDTDLSDGAGPQIAMPRPGVYDVDVLVEALDNAAGETAAYLYLKVNGSTVEQAITSDGDGLKPMAITKRVTVTTAGHIVKVTYGALLGGTNVFARHRELKITPVRIG